MALWMFSACAGESVVLTDDTALHTQDEATEGPLQSEPDATEASGTDINEYESAEEPTHNEAGAESAAETSVDIIEEAESENEPIPEPSPPLVTEEGIVWLVPPMFEHDYITFCDHCNAFFDSQRRSICSVTGVRLDEFGWGHGTGQVHLALVYDPVLSLFGEPQLSGGYNRSYVGMHPFDEASDIFGTFDGWFGIIQAVDSTRRNSMENWWYIDGERFYHWYLTEDAFLGKFAIISNGVFTTDFIFDGGFVPGWICCCYEGLFNAAVVSIDGEWGVVDNYGNPLTPFMYDRIYIFDGSRVIAVYNGKHGLIDRYGTIVVPFLFDQIYHFGLGFNPNRIVAVYDGKHGVIDETGNTVIPFLFDHIFDINGTTAFAKYNGKYGIIDVSQTEANVNNISQNFS